ncbi:competence protein ComEA [Aliidiomarina taiwanensis]|uniref:Competence protein ComEA n=1 Tax=Aliidiomarina taiwanensis TaxID=946228 RepID=A0A432X9E6_9GAMM|nr:helix-hairpin-helix domain-containing protein [Aliidiomarina taiwanensis]RUO44043.1 competence protein ComEA [Aliidiomarina taiwanensis]
MFKKTLLFASLISPLALASPPQVYAAELPTKPVASDMKQAQETININTATVEELAASLKGVGMSRARAIVELRERLGGFSDIDQLLEVRGLGVRTLDANRDRIRL